IVLLVGGVPLAFVPWLADVHLPPDIVLLIFLPALLYWESLNTSLREIRANLRAVLNDSILLVLATAGAVAIAGPAFGPRWLTARVRKLMHDPLLENTVNLLAPFVAFLLAEEIHASGVLAVVVCGLMLSQLNPRLVPARTRVPSRAFWQLSTFLLNGTLFVLV